MSVFKLVFFVPEEYLDSVKQAVFSTGAGGIGDYDQCCWQTLGQGQFRPKSGSNPFIGEKPKEGEETAPLTYVKEYRVELVSEGSCIQAAVMALKEAHPYEEPAYEVYRLEDY